MTLPRRAAALALVAIASTGCALPESPSAPPQPAPTSATAPTLSASPTPTPGQLDLTAPGAARALITRLMDAAESTRAIMVTVTASDASVAVLKSGRPETWAWRDGAIKEVPSDIVYVDQHTFDPHEFMVDDVGALFRVAQAVSGSNRGQSLQIVDYSAGLVSMTVSTNPESRAVFFNADGTVLPTLDFTSAWGLAQGYQEAVGERRSASAVGFGSATGVYFDAPVSATGTLNRRQRTARTPVIMTPRTESPALLPFDPATVDPLVVWSVLDTLQQADQFTLDTSWTCIADDRAATGTPQLHFTVGDRSFTTDLSGAVVKG